MPTPMPSGNQNASKAAEVAPPPPPAAATHERKFAAKRVPPDRNTQQALTSSSPPTSDSVEASDQEARRLTEEEARRAAVRRDQMKLGLNSASEKPKAAKVMQRSPASNTASEDKGGYSARAIQPGKVGRQAMDAMDKPTASAAVGTARAYRMEGAPPTAAPSPVPESKQVNGEGCVERGVEAGCLMVKDRSSGNLYRIVIKGQLPKPGDCIEFTGVPDNGVSFCMQGIPLDVITWVKKSSLKCAQAEPPKQ